MHCRAEGRGRCCYHFHFIDEEPGPEKLNQLTNVIYSKGSQGLGEEVGNTHESTECHNKKLDFIILAKQMH